MVDRNKIKEHLVGIQLIRKGALLALMLIGAAFSQNAMAVPAWTLDSVTNFRNASWSFGDIFTVGGSNISVTSLGAFDASLDGFVTPGGIEVGIFREIDDVLLASVFVTSGDTLVGNYRFSSITPLILLANTQYRVVAVNRNDLYNIATGTPDNVNPGITWNSYGYCQTTTLTSCDVFTGTERTWMANFDIDSVPVPEPATLALFGLGLVGLGFSRRRRRS